MHDRCRVRAVTHRLARRGSGHQAPFRVDNRTWGDNRRVDLVSQPEAYVLDLARPGARPPLPGVSIQDAGSVEYVVPSSLTPS